LFQTLGLQKSSYVPFSSTPKKVKEEKISSATGVTLFRT